MPSSQDGVDPSKINRNAEYTLQQLSAIFPYSVQALRKAISEGTLKARKKGKYLLVTGKDAIAWWKKD
jgi:hypothetical protein